MVPKNNGLNMQKVAEAVAGTLDSLGNVEMGGVRLDNPNKELLDLRALSFDLHVAMHPGCIAYYGALRREALRALETLKRSYERWHLKMWTEAKVKACGGSAQYKPTVNDIEARLIVDHEKELEDWDERLGVAQKHADDLGEWFEGWRQKSFSLHDHAKIDEEERYAAGGGFIKGRGDSGASGENGKDKIQRVRDIIRKRREASGGASV